jgi:hypothetical protein
MLYACILKVLNSNLGHDTGYPGWSLSWFSPVDPGKCWDNVLPRPTSTSFQIIHNSLLTVTSYHTILRYVVWREMLTSLSNKERYIPLGTIYQTTRRHTIVITVRISNLTNAVMPRGHVSLCNVVVTSVLTPCDWLMVIDLKIEAPDSSETLITRIIPDYMLP